MIQKLLENIAATAELMGTQLSPMALAVMAKDLQEYDVETVLQALSNVRKNANRFNLAVIITEIEILKPDGRLGADEAWAIYPHDDGASAVLTNEIAEAMQVAHPLMLEGDKIGARMAFKEAYTRIVKTNKANEIKPKWFPSLGHDKQGREEVLKRAVELGRLTQDHVTSLLPAPIHSNVQKVIGSMQLLTFDEKLTPEQQDKNKARMAKIKAMLAP